MGRYSGKTCRLLCMIGLTASFFLVEIIVGYITNSLALVGDSYHMLSDVIALIIGFASVRISKWRSRKNTYGWARAEVLGAMTNAVFLIALCFTIFVEALQRISHDDHIHQPDLMLIVGGIGLGINIIGLIMFGSHGHSHGGHGHSHGGHGHSHGGVGHDRLGSDQGHENSGSDAEGNDMTSEHGDDDVAAVAIPQRTPKGGVTVNGEVVSLHDSDNEDFPIVEEEQIKLRSSAQLNMRAVFLHVMGDALGSVIVIISALVIKYVEADWKYKIDPAMSMVLVIIILSTSIPLLRESSLILLQTVPTHIQVHDLRNKLMTKVDGVMGIHEFHVWQLAGNRIIASAHIRCQNLRDYMRIAEQVKLFFHNEGIHSTTIQPEFAEDECGAKCLLNCPCIDKCSEMKCCPDDRHNQNKQPGWMKSCRKRKRKKEILLDEIIVRPNDEKKMLLTEEFIKPVENGGLPSITAPPYQRQDSSKTPRMEDSLLSQQSTQDDPGSVVDKSPEDPADAKVFQFFQIPEFKGVQSSDADPSDVRDEEHPRSRSEPQKVTVPSSLSRNNKSLPSVNSDKYYPRFKAPIRLSRPQSMYAVPGSAPLGSSRRTLSSEILHEAPELEPHEPTRSYDQYHATLPSPRHRNKRPQTVDGATGTNSFPVCVSEDNLDIDIQKLKQDWKEIRGDMASRESVLNS